MTFRPFGLAGDDRPIRNGLVGVAGEKSANIARLRIATNVQAGPAEVGLPLDCELESEITVLHVVPLTPADLIPGTPSCHAVRAAGEWSPRADADSGIQGGCTGHATTDFVSPDSVSFLARVRINVQKVPIGPTTSWSPIPEDEISFSIVIEIKRKLLIESNVLVSGRVDNLCFSGLYQRQHSHPGCARSESILTKLAMN